MDTPKPSPPPQFSQFDLARFAAKFDFVVPEAVIPNLHAMAKTDAIRQLVAKLASVGAFPEDCERQILAAVMGREELGTTAIGRGVAVPHARHAAVPRVMAAVGFAPDGMNFEALDQSPVHLLVLVLAPLDAAAQNLRALQQIVTELRAV